MFKVATITGLIVGILLITYGNVGPWYTTTPFRDNYSLTYTKPQYYEFKVNKSEEYLLEIELVRQSQCERLNCILPSHLSPNEKQPISTSWQLESNNVKIAGGTSSEHSYSPFFGEEVEGVVIGRFQGAVSENYVLTVKNEAPHLEFGSLSSNIRVSLHPAKREHLIGFTLLGIVLVLLSFPLLIWLFLRKEPSRGSKSAENMCI